ELYPKDFYIYPTFSPFLAKKIIKEIFSFSNPKEEVLFLSNQIKYSEFMLLLKQFFPKLEGVQKKENLVREALRFKKRFLVEINLKNALSETFQWLAQFPPKIS